MTELTDNDLIGRLTATYQRVADATVVNTPRSIEDFDDVTVAPVVTLTPRPRSIRILTGLAVAAAVALGAVMTMSRLTSNPVPTAAPPQSLRHVVLWTAPEGYGYIGVVPGAPGTGETSYYAAGSFDDEIPDWRLTVLRRGEVQALPDGQASTVESRGRIIDVITTADGVRHASWQEAQDLDVILSVPPQKLDGDLVLNDLVAAISYVTFVTDAQWNELQRRSGFFEFHECVKLQAQRSSGGLSTLTMAIGGSVQRGVTWRIGPESRSFLPRGAQQPGDPEWRLTADPNEQLAVGESLFPHPNAPSMYVVVPDDFQNQSCDELEHFG